ncbi:MAG: hypothetical protein IJ612_03630 [Prevotella sp.]|nr:hypothetical protein [Prevotella sp.]
MKKLVMTALLTIAVGSVCMAKNMKAMESFPVKAMKTFPEHCQADGTVIDVVNELTGLRYFSVDRTLSEATD